jgi:hypothetical protein
LNLERRDPYAMFDADVQAALRQAVFVSRLVVA